MDTGQRNVRIARIGSVLLMILGLVGAVLPTRVLASPTPGADEAPVLAFTRWTLAQMQTGPNEASSPAEGETFSLVFGEGDAVTVETDCASTTGTIAIAANHDVVPNLKAPEASTCERRSLPERFLNNLNMVSSWIFEDDGTLVLNLAADGGFIRLHQDLVGTTWRWTGLESSDESTVEPGGYYSGTLLFQEDGMVVVDTRCASGTLPYTANADGELTIDTRGLDLSECTDASGLTRFTQDLAHLRSFVFRDGMLFVSLIADGGIHTFVASRPHD